MTEFDVTRRIVDHWASRGDPKRLATWLARSGLVAGTVPVEALAPLDQLHVGQLQATIEVARAAHLQPALRILDAGAGLGGSARYLAARWGCVVTALELSPVLVEAGRELTRWCALEARVRHVRASLEAPPEDLGPFDLVWLQHVDMHVPDKRALYRACRTLLAPGGRILWHDWLAGSSPPLFPVPWSEDGDLTWLLSRTDFEATLAVEDLVLADYRDLAAETTRWLCAANRAIEAKLGRGAGPRTQELQAILQANANVMRNIREERLVPFLGEATRRCSCRSPAAPAPADSRSDSGR